MQAQTDGVVVSWIRVYTWHLGMALVASNRSGIGILFVHNIQVYIIDADQRGLLLSSVDRAEVRI